MVSLKSSPTYSWDIKKSFLNFFFFKELSRFKFLCDAWHVLLAFSIIFVQIKIISLKILIQKYIL